MENTKYEKDITITVSGKDKREVAKKIAKVYYLLSFMKKDSTNFGVFTIFFIALVMFLFNVFFGVFLSQNGIYSKQYLGSSITPSAYVYSKIEKDGFFVLSEKTEKRAVTNCGSFYCIDGEGKIFEKPAVQVFVIKDFNIKGLFP